MATKKAVETAEKAVSTAKKTTSKKTTAKKTAAKKTTGKKTAASNRKLVIVESPASWSLLRRQRLSKSIWEEDMRSSLRWDISAIFLKVL